MTTQIDTQIVDTSVQLRNRLEEIKSLVGNGQFNDGFTALNDAEMFTPAEIEQLKAIAKFIGVDYDKTKNTVGISVSGDNAPRLTRPTIISDGKTLCFRWGEQTVPIQAEVGGACQLVKNEITSDYVTFTLQLEVCAEVNGEEETYCLDFPMVVNKGVTNLPTRSLFFKIIAAGEGHPQHAGLLANFRRADSIGKFSELGDGTYTLKPSEPLKTASGKVMELVEVEGHGRFWSPKELTQAMLPATVVKDKGTIKVGELEISLSSFTKLKELEIGQYQVVGYKWSDYEYQGKTITSAALELEDGRVVGSNKNIESFLKNSTPEITKEFPATLHVDSKKDRGEGKVQVNCRLVPTRITGLMAAIAGVAKKAEEAQLLAV